MQFCQVFGNRTSNEPLLNELFADFNNIEEPLITSTNNGTSSPFENPADISLQVRDYKIILTLNFSQFYLIILRKLF